MDIIGFGQNQKESLSSVFIHLMLLKRGIKGPDIEDYCNRVGSSSVQLERVTNMVAEHARLSNGMMAHAAQKVNLAEFLTLLFETAAKLMRVDSVDLCFVTPTSPLIVSTEPEYILSSVGQLLSNAVQYHTPGTPICAKCTANPAHIEIEVANRGTPIPRDVCAKMFDPYFQYNPAGDFQVRSGLGLTIAKLYAEWMGGSLTFEQFDENSVFRLILPLTSVEDDTALWQMDELEMFVRLCVILSDTLGIFDEFFTIID